MTGDYENFKKSVNDVKVVSSGLCVNCFRPQHIDFAVKPTIHQLFAPLVTHFVSATENDVILEIEAYLA